MKNNKIIQSVIAILPAALLVLLFIGCGNGAEAPNQSVEAPETPEYPELNDHLLGLTPNTSAIGYGGTTLIFNEEADPIDLATVLQASIDSRIAWANAKRFEVETRYKEFYTDEGIIAGALTDMKAELRRYEKEARDKNPLSLSDQVENSKTWTKTKFDELYVKDDEQSEQADFLWQRYCDAKVLELASNSTFAKTLYSERPSPMQFCEEYYQTNNFFTGPSCEPNSQGANYFSCLWIEGAFKTWWFKNLYFSADPSVPITDNSEEKIRSLLSPEQSDLFQSILSLSEETIDTSRGPIKKRIFGADGKIKTYFSDIILKQIDQGKICTLAIKSLADFCSLFAISWQNNLLNDKSLASQDSFALTPFTTISMIEGSDSSLNQVFDFPKLSNSNQISLKELISYVGTRVNHSLSESDRIFHKPLTNNQSEQSVWPSHIIDKIGSIQSLLSDTLYGRLSSQDQIEVDSRKQNIADLSQTLDQAQSQNDKYQAEITATTNRGFQAGYLPNLAHAFLETRLKISNRNGVIRAYLWFKGYEDHVVIGCFNATNETSIPKDKCDIDKNDRIAAINVQKTEKFSVDSSTGRIDFTVELVDPEIIGLGIKPKVDTTKFKPDSFMELAPEKLQGKQLAFELFPNRLLDYLEILSGKAFIRENGNDLYEAGVSLWDQNL